MRFSDSFRKASHHGTSSVLPRRVKQPVVTDLVSWPMAEWQHHAIWTFAPSQADFGMLAVEQCRRLSSLCPGAYYPPWIRLVQANNAMVRGSVPWEWERHCLPSPPRWGKGVRASPPLRFWIACCTSWHRCHSIRATPHACPVRRSRRRTTPRFSGHCEWSTNGGR